jgi:hypothetical protein
MIMNIQQFMPEQMWVETTGDDGKWTSQPADAGHADGEFQLPSLDGSLPFDKTALVESLEGNLLGVAQDPELRQRYRHPGKIFQYVAELGGAKNIDSFQRQFGALMLGAKQAQYGNTGQPRSTWQHGRLSAARQ